MPVPIELLSSPDARMFLEALLEQAPIGLAFLDREHRFVHINGHLAEINGFSVEEHLGRRIDELLPSLAPAVHAVTGQILRTGTSQPAHEFAGETPAQPGVRRHWLEYWFPVRRGGSTIVGFGVVVQEVSDRIRAARDLAERTERLDLLTRVSHELITNGHTDSGALGRILRDVAETLGFDLAFMYRAETGAERLHLEHSVGVGPDSIDRLRQLNYGEFLCGEVARSARELILGPEALAQWPDARALCAQGMHCYVGLPILANGELLGTIGFATCESRTMSDGERRLLRTVCDQVASTMYRDRLFAAVRRSEERLRFTLDSGDVAVWDYDPATDTTVWTGNTASLYGLEIDRMPTDGASYRALLHPDDVGEALARFEQALEGGRDVKSDFRVIWPNGEVHWLHGRAVVIHDHENRPVRVTGVNLNVTDRYRADEALRESEQRLRISMEAAFLVGFTWDVQRDEVHRPYSATDLLPPTNERPERLADVLRVIHPDDRPVFMQAIERALTGTDGRYENEFRIVLPDGKEQWMYERGVVRFDADGRPKVLVGVSQDITIRKLAEQSVQDANRRKDEFLATLAHELRNPLAPIRNAVELLRGDGHLDSASRRAVGIIDRQVTHMVRLVDDLLDVNRITRGEVTLHRRPLNLADVVQAAVETTRPVFAAAAHDLQIRLPSPPVYIMGDATRMSQALANLLGNAARYTPHGGQIAVEVRLDPSHPHTNAGDAVISVRDNGAGIPAGMRERIFEMFTQAPEMRGRGGLGIGLAIVRRITAMHQGTVSVHSDGTGKGSTFEMRLPAIAAPVPGDPWRDAERTTG